MIDTFSAHRHTDSSVPISMERTALLVVDMLKDFCIDGGAMVLPGAEQLYPPQNALIDAVRSHGGAVIFVNDCHRPEMRRDREMLMREPHCFEGSWGAEIVDELDRQEGDLQVTKRRYSGFFNTDLDLTLKDMQVDTVIVMGVVTNICVRSTVHDAFFHGYKVIVPEDCVAATGPREQESTLYDIATHFGVVTNSRDLIDAIVNDKEVVAKEVAA